MAYAIVKLGGKQYRVREGERLTVDRLPHEENATFEPDVLLLGGDGKTELAPKSAKVTARIVEHGRGPKIRIGKYRPKNGYKKHTGFRAAVSEVLIESIGATKTRKAAETKDAPAEETKPKRAPAKPKAESAAAEKPKAAAAKKPAAKPKSKKDEE
jgi:large subunit ribosomal protein L21